MKRLRRCVFRCYVKFRYCQSRPLPPDDELWFWAIK